MIVPGGGISLDRERWISSRVGFLLPVRVVSKLFRRLFLARLQELHATGRVRFFGDHIGLTGRRAFLRNLVPLRKKKWVVYAKPPFSGPQAVLAYLSRYTHRVAISNRRLIAFNETGVTCYKDYRRDGADRQRIMTPPRKGAIEAPRALANKVWRPSLRASMRQQSIAWRLQPLLASYE
jgi:hypothetical protein